MNTLAEFDAFLTKAQNLSFEQKRASLETQYDKYTHEGDVSEEDYRDIDSAGLGLMAYTPLGAQNHRDTYKPGTEIVVKFKKYTTSVTTPEELREAMMNNGRIKMDKVKRFARIGDDCLETATRTREYITTDFLLRATSTTPTNSWAGTFRDGLALASSSHTLLKSSSTWSNLQTGSAMTQLALLDGLAMLTNIPDENGFPQGSIGEVYLLYGPYNQFRVTELLKTMTTPYSANLTVNPLAEKRERTGKITPVYLDYLGTSFTGWGLLDAKNHGLTRFEKQPPKLMSDKNINNGDMINRCMMRYAIYARSAKGFVVNPGI
jgi:hypothetical protein